MRAKHPTSPQGPARSSSSSGASGGDKARPQWREASDAFLYLSAAAGSERAFTLLYERYRAPLTGFIARITGDIGQAEDIQQQIWVDLARGLHGGRQPVRAPEHVRLWLFQRARWRALDGVRRNRKQTSVTSEHMEQLLDADADRHNTGAEPDLTLDQLARHMAGLGEEARTVLHLFYREDMSIQEIAHILKLPPNTVKTRLRRARLSLRASLEGAEEQPEP